MLSKEDIERNKQEFISLIYSIEREFNKDRLIEWLENKSDFFTAPASSKHHGSYEGGLCDHSLNVYYGLKSIAFSFLSYDLDQEGNAHFKYPEDTFKIVGLLHDISKANYYEKYYRNVKDEKGNYNLVNIKLRNTFIEQIYKLMQNGMFDMTIPDEKDKDVRTTIMMDKQELQEYINRLNEYYEVSYYEVARLDEPKKGYQKKYLTIDETNDNGEKLFKLVELVTDDKKYPQKKANRIVGAIRVKEKEKVKVS